MKVSPQPASLKLQIWFLRNINLALRRRASQRNLARARRVLPQVLASMPRAAGGIDPSRWHIPRSCSGSGATVLVLGPIDQLPIAVAKVPHNSKDAEYVSKQAAMLTVLHADSRLAAWQAFIPAPLGTYESDGLMFSFEQALPGCTLRSLWTDAGTCQRAYQSAVVAIDQFHRCTASRLTVNDAVLERWIDHPLRSLRTTGSDLSSIDHLARHMRRAISGQTLTTSWIHGDFWASNILVTCKGDTVTGIVDWDHAAPDELPVLDALHLLLDTRVVKHVMDTGQVIGEFLTGMGWTEDELAILNAAGPRPEGNDIGDANEVLLYWLRWLRFQLDDRPYLLGHKRWLSRNVQPILQCF